MLNMLNRLRGRKRESAGARLVVSPDVTASTHANGVVFLHSGKGAVFTANATGARMWEALRRGCDAASIASELAAEFGVAPEIVTRDAERFAAELEAEGILLRSVAA